MRRCVLILGCWFKFELVLKCRFVLFESWLCWWGGVGGERRLSMWVCDLLSLRLHTWTFLWFHFFFWHHFVSPNQHILGCWGCDCVGVVDVWNRALCISAAFSHLLSYCVAPFLLILAFHEILFVFLSLTIIYWRVNWPPKELHCANSSFQTFWHPWVWGGLITAF